ncbi:hypothetical protein H9W90_12765 [Polaribacter pectinis]|uniref:Glycine dehydrogenase n=1 Tax=Polaribacter pectinis TaxID=2738844 RepID=A0A7G9L8V7_9FLAO|nr:hypothetical protein [Polaribacter pectinis]QNM85056.1 hypothetical protein H9W90_12765 [Polaribacter pectinis]
MFKRLKITCDEATTICDKNQYGEATLLDKIKLNIHFIRCKICFKYTKQNMTLTKIYKGHAISCKELKHCLSAEDKEALKKSLENNKA